MLEEAPLFAVVGLLVHQGKVLGISRKHDHLDIGLPGGKIDPGETPEEALVRELQEETGITALDYRPVFDHLDRVDDAGNARPCRCFLVTRWHGVPVSLEGARLGWFNPIRLTAMSCSFREYNKALFHGLAQKALRSGAEEFRWLCEGYLGEQGPKSDYAHLVVKDQQHYIHMSTEEDRRRLVAQKYNVPVSVVNAWLDNEFAPMWDEEFKAVEKDGRKVFLRLLTSFEDDDPVVE